MRKSQNGKRNFSTIKLEEAMQLIGRETITLWQLNAPPRPASDALKTHLQRLNFFDLQSSEQAKTLLIDALFAEIVPEHAKLKVWKAAPLASDTLTGVADYLIAPYRAYLATPLLCVTEAKKDDFELGQAQCLAEMLACQWNNRQRNQEVDVYGIVSNGQGWVFYKLTTANEIFETNQYGLEDLLGLLGALDTICAECTKNIP